MNRILGIELRRSAALGSGLVLLVLGVLLLYLFREVQWSEGWMQLAMSQRLYLALLWPLALAAGAWQARREHLSNVTELFASTPRSQARRSVPVLAAMAVAVVGGYLLMTLAAAVRIVGIVEYFPVRALIVTAVGALSLVAAVWLGLAIGRLLPWLITAPALAVAGLGLLLTIPAMTRPRSWLSLVFSPIEMMNMPGPWADVPVRVSVAQTLWLLALAGAGVLLFASGSRRNRAAALLPVALGAALAVAVMPHQNRLVHDAVDPVAQEMVCADGEPRVCLSRAHAGLLPEVTARAREGLATLAKLPGAPVAVHEDTTTYYPDVFPPWQPEVALVRIEVGPDGHLKAPGRVPADVVAAAFASPPTCEKSIGYADTLAAAAWLTGREPEAATAYDDPEPVEEAKPLWQDLRKLPAGEATTRVAAVRDAAVNCRDTGRLPRSSR